MILTRGRCRRLNQCAPPRRGMNLGRDASSSWKKETARKIRNQKVEMLKINLTCT